MLTLVIGGARSGKSRFAQSLAVERGREGHAQEDYAREDNASVPGGRLDRRLHTFIATARAEDAEMAARIARHRLERPAGWITVEEPLEIAGAVARCAREGGFIVLDCLTLWLSNFCWEHRGEDGARMQEAALAEVARLAGAAAGADLVVVTNEVGCGVVPESAVGRAFRDLQGWVNQEAARSADWVYHVVAGIAVAIKRPETEGRAGRV